MSTSQNTTDYLSRPSSELIEKNRWFNLEEMQAYTTLQEGDSSIGYFGISREKMVKFQRNDPEIVMSIQELDKKGNLS